MSKKTKQTVKDVKIDLIDEPKDVLRLDIDSESIQELAQSIDEIGLLQPILVAIQDSRYEVVFGHRRFLACKVLQLSTIRSIVREMTAEEIGIARATENINRADLTPIEEANTYSNLIHHYGMSLEQVAKRMAKGPGTVRRRMDLLKMPPPLQQALHQKRISISVAEELWSIADPADLDYYLTFALEGGCTKEVARSWAKEWKDKKRRAEAPDMQGNDTFSPQEPRPVYVTCDLCLDPMKIGEETLLRICPKCAKTIKQNM